MRTKRIYTLDVEYPEGVDYHNPPQAWLDYINSLDIYGDEPAFHFPRRRNFLTKDAAERRAGYLREYGCVVKVIASKPIEWSDDLWNEEKKKSIADLGD